MAKYLVATYVELDMEYVGHYEKFDIIEAENENEARAKYNEKHNCSHHYASCLGTVNEETGIASIHISHFKDM